MVRGAPSDPGRRHAGGSNDHSRCGRPDHRGHQWKTPTFVFQGNIASFNPAKQFVSLLFHRGGEIPGEHPRLEGDGPLAKVMRFTDVADVENHRADLEAVVRAWCTMKDSR